MNTMTTFTYLLNLEKSLDPCMDNKIKKYEEKKKKLLAKTLIQKEIFQEALYDFGTTYDNFNHSYLGLNLSSKDLISIGGITEFKYIQNVNLSNNSLTTLEQLSGLNHLTTLDASYNKIEEIMDFNPPQNLEEVNYSYNLVQTIQNVEKNLYLKVLKLNNNNIAKIEGLSCNNYLEELDLSCNQIEVIENLENLGVCLQKLNLMSNQIKSITGLENLTSLIELNLSKNFISRMKGLQGLVNLRYLYLSSNKLSRCKQVAYIIDLHCLTDVDFCYNDVQTRKFYRYQILFYLPQLRLLDGQLVSHYEKVKADILFGADLNNKREIFKTYLPEEQFVDRRLFLMEQIDPESDSEEELLEGKDKQNSSNVSKNLSISSIGKKTRDDQMYKDTESGNINAARNEMFTY